MEGIVNSFFITQGTWMRQSLTMQPWLPSNSQIQCVSASRVPVLCLSQSPP